MKCRLIVLFLIVSLASWAQTNSPASSNAPGQSSSAQETAKDCSDCCKHMGEGKDAGGCCHNMHAKGESKDPSCSEANCCMGKGGKACMKDASAKASCADGKCCEMKDGKGCCSHADGEKTAMACCSGKQCGKGHDHTGLGK